MNALMRALGLQQCAFLLYLLVLWNAPESAFMGRTFTCVIIALRAFSELSIDLYSHADLCSIAAGVDLPFFLSKSYSFVFPLVAKPSYIQGFIQEFLLEGGGGGGELFWR